MSEATKSDPDRLRHAVEFISEVVKQCREGGSFRHFIYDRLGFGQDAYAPLYQAGGMVFTNATPINMEPECEPNVAWVGMGTVVETLSPTNIRVEWPTPQDGAFGIDTYQPWKGHEFSVGDVALCIYLSTAAGGNRYALKPGHYRTSDLASELT